MADTCLEAASQQEFIDWLAKFTCLFHQAYEEMRWDGVFESVMEAWENPNAEDRMRPARVQPLDRVEIAKFAFEKVMTSAGLPSVSDFERTGLSLKEVSASQKERPSIPFVVFEAGQFDLAALQSYLNSSESPFDEAFSDNIIGVVGQGVANG